MNELLFHSHHLRATIENQGRHLANEINSLNEDEALNTSHEDMINYLVDKYRINPLVIDESGIQMDHGDAQIDVSGDYRRAIFDRSKPFHITGTHVTFYVPFTGDSELFKCRPSTFSLNPPRASVRSNELVFSYNVTAEERSSVEGTFRRELEQTQVHVERVNTDVADFNSPLRDRANQVLNARRDKLLRDRDMIAEMGFPLRRRGNSPSTFVTPEVKRKITSRKPAPSSEPFRPEPALGQDEYDYILSILSNMVAVMERTPSAFKNMGEEDLRTHFLVHLNGHYEGQATGETFNYVGKTDILVRSEGRNIFIAECKFWTGPRGLTEALDQLLGYTAWRDSKAALLIFNRNTNMSTILERIPETIQEHPNYKAARRTNSETEFRYIFGNRNDVNREIILTVLVFDVPR